MVDTTLSNLRARESSSYVNPILWNSFVAKKLWVIQKIQPKEV